MSTTATARLRCRAAGDPEFGSCPAGVLRMEGGQGSVTVQNQLGEQFTINFMTDYVNATNREVEARLEGDTWILNFANGEVWEAPLAMIEGVSAMSVRLYACLVVLPAACSGD